MTPPFVSPLATQLQGFLVFKRALGYKYQRGEFTLREFDRFLSHYVGGRRRWHLRDAVLAWLCRKEGRKPVTVTFELAVIRQFCLYRRRSEPSGFVPGRVWAPQSTEAKFLPYIFTLSQMRRLLRVATQLDQPGPRFPRELHALVLVLYCTGLRLGEVARLRLADVDLKRGVLFVSQSKGRSRWVPFHPSLTPELRRYLAHRGYGSDSAEPFFLRQNGRPLSAQWVSDQLRGLFRRAGMKPAAGRVGPRRKGRKERFCPLWSETVRALRQICLPEQGPQALIFRNSHGAPLTRDGVAYIVAKYATEAAQQYPALRRCRVTPHVLRHSCAVALLQAGVDVTVIRDYLGHASISTTSRYISTNLQMRRDVLERFWDKAGLRSHGTDRWRPTPKLLEFLSSL